MEQQLDRHHQELMYWKKTSERLQDQNIRLSSKLYEADDKQDDTQGFLSRARREITEMRHKIAALEKSYHTVTDLHAVNVDELVQVKSENQYLRDQLMAHGVEVLDVKPYAKGLASPMTYAWKALMQSFIDMSGFKEDVDEEDFKLEYGVGTFHAGTEEV